MDGVHAPPGSRTRGLPHLSRLPAVLGVLAVAIVVALSGAGKAAASVDAGGSYWGAWIGNQFTGSQPPWDMNALSDFEKITRKQVSTLNWSSPTYDRPDCGGYCAFQSAQFDAVRAAGVIPFFSWNTGGVRFTDAQIASGALDGYFTAWARAARAWGHPFFLRFDWEMNGSWFPWGVASRGNTAADYVAMWRHVHDIFTTVGATNVNWVWCPNIDQWNKLASLASLYPGEEYVDWTGLDGYNQDSPWTSFADLYRSSYARITGIAPSKPMIIGEVGSTAIGGSKAQWITDMFNALATQFPQVHGVQWFEENQPGFSGLTDWPIEVSAPAARAFAGAISRPSYQTSHYGSLNASVIPVPPPTVPARTTPAASQSSAGKPRPSTNRHQRRRAPDRRVLGRRHAGYRSRG